MVLRPRSNGGRALPRSTLDRMRRFLFASHDGFGVGHTRRNTLIAEAILAASPDAEVVLLTGIAVRPTWVHDDRLTVVQLPPLVKDAHGAYRHATLSFEDAIAERARRFADVVRTFEPDCIVVDRHPFGIAGELRSGIVAARRRGARVVLGLRDVLDVPAAVRAELAGDGWNGVGELFDDVFVYGEPWLCDHRVEYGLPVEPTYCGWVTPAVAPAERDPSSIVVCAGGGGDGDEVFRLGLELVPHLTEAHLTLVVGPYGSRPIVEQILTSPAHRAHVDIVPDVPSCADLIARAGGVVQMAGYNSTFEALAAGLRPVLVPRRSPRREQAIRAERLAAVGLADMVDERSDATELAWLLRRDRRLDAATLRAADLRLDGAERAARLLASGRLVPTC